MKRFVFVFLMLLAQSALATDLMWYNRTTSPKPIVCLELVDPDTGDFLQSAPGTWSGGTAPAGEFRVMVNNSGTYSDTDNQGAFVDEGTACVTLSSTELQNELLIVKARDSSGCPSSCAYLPSAVYIQTIGNTSAYHDGNQ